MAPGADVIVYQGPDNRNTALLYAWNEAIGRGEVSVLTTSFAHREDSEPKPLRHQYDESALMGAALGMTVISASGDSARPDTPCSSPYVTCVGGTKLTTDGSGNVLGETAWSLVGLGRRQDLRRPGVAEGHRRGSKRAMTDVAINASPGKGYWIRRFGNGRPTAGPRSRRRCSRA
jgi:kumamolisin